jgi:hypothetical protein
MSELLFPRSAAEADREQVTRALIAQLPAAALTDGISEHARALIAIAESFRVPIGALLNWIGYAMPGKEWSTREFERWSAKYAADIATAPELASAEKPAWTPARCGHCHEWLLTEAQAASHVCHMLCPTCCGHSAQRVNGRWLCANCGEVTAA